MQRSRTKTADETADELEAHAKELMKIASDMRTKKTETARGRQAKTGRTKKK